MCQNILTTQVNIRQLTSLSKTLLASYSFNVAEVELPFCERRRMGLIHTNEERVTSYCFSCLL